MIGSSRYSDTSTVSPFGSTRSVTSGICTAAAGGPMGGGVERLGPKSDAALRAAGADRDRPASTADRRASSRHRRRPAGAMGRGGGAPGFGRSGTSSTVVRSASIKYVLATRCTSAAVTASTRSTSLNISR